MDNSQWKEGVYVAILTSMNLTECHGMAISGAVCSQEGAQPRGRL